MCQRSGRTCCSGCTRKTSKANFHFGERDQESQESLEKRGHLFGQVSVTSSGNRQTIIVPVTMLMAK